MLALVCDEWVELNIIFQCYYDNLLLGFRFKHNHYINKNENTGANHYYKRNNNIIYDLINNRLL